MKPSYEEQNELRPLSLIDVFRSTYNRSAVRTKKCLLRVPQALDFSTFNQRNAVLPGGASPSITPSPPPDLGPKTSYKEQTELRSLSLTDVFRSTYNRSTLLQKKILRVPRPWIFQRSINATLSYREVHHHQLRLPPPPDLCMKPFYEEQNELRALSILDVFRSTYNRSALPNKKQLLRVPQAIGFNAVQPAHVSIVLEQPHGRA